MRTLRFFFSSFLLLVFLGVVGFFILRELLLYMAVTDMKRAIGEMDKIERSGSDFRSQCNQRGTGSLGGVKQIQTKFTSSTNYQVEVLCQFNTNDPIVAVEETLPLWVTKVPGEAGFIWDEDGRSGMSLQILGRKTTIILDGKDILTSQGITEIDGNKPPAYCAGFGYQCCDAITSIGEGQPLAEAIDCSSNCYMTCQSRPVVLRLYSDPVPDARTKTLSIVKGSQVSFYYTVDGGSSKNVTVEIDFGDGEIKESTELESMITHTYTCAKATCSYTAKITATDENGNPSISTPLTALQVNVQ